MSNQQFSGMHTHTCFCDGKDDVETMCKAAYENNLFAVGFSAHCPIEKQTGILNEFNIREERAGEYINEVLAAKERWQGKLNVFLGYEVDYIKGMRSAQDNDIKALNLDFLIGSVHYIYPANGTPHFAVDADTETFYKGIKECFNGDAEALMHAYYDAQMEMIATGGFDILGHADIIKKNCEDKDLWPQENEICRQKEIARAAAEAGLIVEVNTGGINRKKIKSVYPSLSFLRLLREQNIPVIITADAHRAEHICGSYDIAVDTLIFAGFSEHVLITGKNNGKIQIKNEKLTKNYNKILD